MWTVPSFLQDARDNSNSSADKLTNGNNRKLSMDLFLERSRGDVDLETKYFYVFNYFYEQYCSEKRKQLTLIRSRSSSESFSRPKYCLEDIDVLKKELEQDIERELSGFLAANPQFIGKGTLKPQSKSCATSPSKNSTKWPLEDPDNFFHGYAKRLAPKSSPTHNNSPPSSASVDDTEISLRLYPDSETLTVEVEELLEPSNNTASSHTSHNRNAFATNSFSSSSQEDASMGGSGMEEDSFRLVHSESIGFVVEYEEDPWLEFKGIERDTSREDEEEPMAISADGEAPEVLCGNRVSQMTRTYHDIDAVTRLLQEKEKDLELAARIGQQLLARNKSLEEKNATLEAEICSSSEKITQLKHDLLMKTELLQIYTNDIDDSSVESTPTSLRHINVDLLQRRVANLENENVYLREEACQLATDTQTCEEKEKELVNDVIRQLNEANLQVNQLSEELSKKIEDNLRAQEETTQLLAQVVDLQATNKRILRENEELGSLVGVARECQEELTTELAELKEKYAEVLDLLHDTQEQLRRVQKKNFPGSRGTHLGSGSLFSSFHSTTDSIASELHSLSSGEEGADKPEGSKSVSRVFDTVRLSSSRLGNSLTPMGYSGGSVYSTPTKQASHIHSHLSTPLHAGGRYSPFSGLSGLSMGGSSGLPSLDSGAESDASFPTDSEDNYPASRSGVPGWPGTPDLDACLRRLGPHDKSTLNYLPYGCRTPDSIMSTGSLKSSTTGYASQDWKLPQKLQIVKPIEGSLTLHQWSRLATPHLGGLLEDKEGIAMKGATNANLNLELYSMSDLEEDDEEEKEEAERQKEEDEGCFPGKQFMSTSGVFTYTNSTVLHPDEVTNITPSLRPTQMSALQSTSVSESSLPPTPSHLPSTQPPSRRGSTATFSTNVGIAKHLRERGFPGEEDGAGMLITATPANSPNRSRPGSPVQQSYKLPGFDDLTKGIHAGASFLRRTFYKGADPSNPTSPTEGPKVNLMERVQAFGVERLVVGNYPQSVGGVVTSRPQSTPPLLHLSNLIRSSAKPSPSQTSTTGDISTVSTQGGSIPSAPKIVSPGERRPQIPPGAPMGIPGHPGAGHLDSRLTQLKPGQRADLGTVGGLGSRPRPSTLGTVPTNKRDEKIGTVGWTSLGRKGGLL